MDDRATPSDLEEAIRAELVALWSDMYWAVREAHEGGWSMRCDNLTARIVNLSRLVGPTSWQVIDIETLKGGVYEKVYRDAGIEYPAVDWVRVDEVERRIRQGR